MSTTPSQELLKYYRDLGFEDALIVAAWQKCKGNLATLMDAIFEVQSENNKAIQNIQNQSGPKSNQDEEYYMNKAILASLEEAKEYNIYNFEPLNPEQRLRHNLIPVGLKNIGNTCYFNSLLQTYFMNFKFVREILQFQEPKFLYYQYSSANSGYPKKGENLEESTRLERLRGSVALVKNLYKLFAYMILSDRKYIDPSEVVHSIKDDFGQPLPIGDYKDIGEFMLYFLSRLDEGLSTQDGNSGYEGKLGPSSDSPMRNSLERQLSNSQIIQSNSSTVSIGVSPNNQMSSSAAPQMHISRQYSSMHSNIRYQSVINEMFFGVQTVKMYYMLNDEIHSNEEEELFNILFLDVRHRDIYSAWDESTINTIDDYKNDRGDIVPAEKYNWIKRPPQTLFFQLQRVVYDPQRQNLKKVNDPFHFDKDLFIDRFLKKNEQAYLDIRQKVNVLKREREVYERALKALAHFKGTHNLQEVLTTASEFLSLQAQEGDTNKNRIDFINRPEIFAAPDNVASLNAAVALLKKYESDVSARITQLEAKVQEVQKVIEQSYTSFHNIKYRLQSILIHDGSTADSGHYYSFICDFQNGRWRRYNDSNILDESEDVVFKEALGGFNNMSAYCLIYTLEETILMEQRNVSVPMRLYQLSSQYATQDMYTAILPNELRELVQTDNKKFHEEIEYYKTNLLVVYIIEYYYRRFEYTNELYRKTKTNIVNHKNSPPVLVSFCIHLKNSPKNDKDRLENLIKWQILDSCVREFHPAKSPLIEILNRERLLCDKLEYHLKYLGPFKAPTSLRLTNFEEEYLNIQLYEYTHLLHYAELSIYLMDCFIQNNIIELPGVMDFMVSFMKEEREGWFFRLMRDTKVIVAIRTLTYLEYQITQNPLGTPEDADLCKIVVSYIKKQFREDAKLIVNFKCWLTDLEGIAYGDLKTIIAELRPSLDRPEDDSTGKSLLEANNEKLSERLKKTALEGDPYHWNQNKKDDALFLELIYKFERMKEVLKHEIDISLKIKRSEIPLMKQDRIRQ